MVRGCPGSEVSWFRGSLVQRFPGSEVPLFGGSVAVLFLVYLWRIYGVLNG